MYVVFLTANAPRSRLRLKFVRVPDPVSSIAKIAVSGSLIGSTPTRLTIEA